MYISKMYIYYTIFLCNPFFLRIFVTAFERVKVVSKKSIAILSLSIKSANFKKEEEFLCFRLNVYAIFNQHTIRREICSPRRRSFDGVCRYQ